MTLSHYRHWSVSEGFAAPEDLAPLDTLNEDQATAVEALLSYTRDVAGRTAHEADKALLEDAEVSADFMRGLLSGCRLRRGQRWAVQRMADQELVANVIGGTK